MLYNLEWLKEGKSFPPSVEKPRLQRYAQNAALFEGEHFADLGYGYGPSMVEVPDGIEIYRKCAQRIKRVIGNFEDVICFPVLLNYQRLMTLKMADLVCGEYPAITGTNAYENAAIQECREYTDFDARLYQAVIDISRYGEAIQRIYKDAEGRYTFTNWDPREWFPVVSQDGTNTILYHCLCWRENRSKNESVPDWYLNVQIHGTRPEDVGHYIHKTYKMDSYGGLLRKPLETKKVPTGLNVCAVRQMKAFSTTNTVYGYDDYMMIDSILSEIMTRIGQISVILDKHADPNITGPVTMLDQDERTGEYRLKTGKFFAVSAGETPPTYMTWEGQLSSAFKQLEMLINQLYILSEMGAALLGSTEGGGQAISGTAMRFKMVNPIAKARRISNSLTRPVKNLFSIITRDAEVPDEVLERIRASQEEAASLTSENVAPAAEGPPAQPIERKLPEEKYELPVPYRHISVFWYDGLPDDPRENIENAKLATGATKMMPLEDAIMEYFGRTHEEALKWIEKIRQETLTNMQMTQQQQPKEEDNPNKPGPQDGTGVNPQKKGSDTGLQSFASPSNKSTNAKNTPKGSDGDK